MRGKYPARGQWWRDRGRERERWCVLILTGGACVYMYTLFSGEVIDKTRWDFILCGRKGRRESGGGKFEEEIMKCVDSVQELLSCF